MTALPPEVQSFLDLHTDFVLTEFNKVKCTVTNHEMPPRLDVLEQHLKGKKYTMQKECYTLDFTKYEPYIVPTRSWPKKMYCTVTKKLLNKDPQEIELHLNGKSFKNKLKVKEEKAKKKKKKDPNDVDNFENNDNDKDREDEDTEEDNDGNADSEEGEKEEDTPSKEVKEKTVKNKQKGENQPKEEDTPSKEVEQKTDKVNIKKKGESQLKEEDSPSKEVEEKTDERVKNKQKGENQPKEKNEIQNSFSASPIKEQIHVEKRQKEEKRLRKSTRGREIFLGTVIDDINDFEIVPPEEKKEKKRKRKGKHETNKKQKK